MTRLDNQMEDALASAFRSRAAEVVGLEPPAVIPTGYLVSAQPPSRRPWRVASIAAAAAVAMVGALMVVNAPVRHREVSPQAAPAGELGSSERVITSGVVRGTRWRLIAHPTSRGQSVRLDAAGMEGQFVYTFDDGELAFVTTPNAALFSVAGPCCRIDGQTMFVAALHPSVRQLVITPTGATPIVVDAVTDTGDPTGWHYAVAAVPPVRGTVEMVTDDGRHHDLAVDGGWNFATIGG